MFFLNHFFLHIFERKGWNFLWFGGNKVHVWVFTLTLVDWIIKKASLFHDGVLMKKIYISSIINMWFITRLGNRWYIHFQYSFKLFLIEAYLFIFLFLFKKNQLSYCSLGIFEANLKRNHWLFLSIFIKWWRVKNTRNNIENRRIVAFFRPVFQYAESIEPNLVIYFTDGDGVIPTDNYQFETIWIIINDNNNEHLIEILIFYKTLQPF